MSEQEDIIEKSEWEKDWDLQGTAAFITQHGFQKITCQFPDDTLNEATKIVRSLQKMCNSQASPVQVLHL